MKKELAIKPKQELVKKEPHGAFLAFSAILVDEHGETLGHLVSTEHIPPRHGRDFEGSFIMVDRTIRQSGSSELTASFNIKL